MGSHREATPSEILGSYANLQERAEAMGMGAEYHFALERIADGTVHNVTAWMTQERGLDLSHAPDIAQKISLSLLRTPQYFNAQTGRIISLMSIVNNAVTDHYRSAYSNRMVPVSGVAEETSENGFFDGMGMVTPDFTDSLVDEMGGGPAMQALRQIPPRGRAIVYLQYVRQFSQQEVADMLGISLGTVKSTGAAALRRLRKTIDPEALYD